jgi:uncharacterized delta-60 repeat protein
VDLADTEDVFLYDRATAATSLVSRSSASPTTAVGGYGPPAISADGAYVVYGSTATNVVTGQADLADTTDVFLFDRTSGTTMLVSHAAKSTTTTGNAGSNHPISISRDGAIVVFASDSTDLIDGVLDTNAGSDVVLFSRSTQRNQLVTLRAPALASRTAGPSYSPSVSADGRFVVYSSGAANLVQPPLAPDQNWNVYLFDRATATTTLISRDRKTFVGGANAPAASPTISADGNFVVFVSSATNLVAGQVDTDYSEDVFLYDRLADSVTLVSHAYGLPQGNANNFSGAPSLSADGRFVAYESYATNLVAGQQDNQFYVDIFLYDRLLDTTALVSRAALTAASGGNGSSYRPIISADGAFVAYTSTASNLMFAGDIGQSDDVFLYDRVQGTNVLVSRDAGGMWVQEGLSMALDLSADGRYLVYESASDYLVPSLIDSNLSRDIFLYDRTLGTSTLVSHHHNAIMTSANGESRGAAISADGAYVVYGSTATNLVTGQTDLADTEDVFLFDRATSATTLVSHASASATTAVGGIWPTISADGQWVVYNSLAENVVSGQIDTSEMYDLFRFDRLSNNATLISYASNSRLTAGGSSSGEHFASHDGQVIAFSSESTRLVADDYNADTDIFIWAPNQPPVNAVPGQQLGRKNKPLVFSRTNGNQFAVFDADARTDAVQVTLSATHGTLAISTAAGLLSVSGNRSPNVQMTGTIGAMNRALDGLLFTPEQDYVGSALLQIVTNDLGTTGEGGAASDTDQVPIKIHVPGAGSLDATFNAGIVTTSIGAVIDAPSQQGVVLALQPDGKAILAGQSNDGGDFDFVLLRYNADGTLDDTFGNGGRVTTSVSSGDDLATAVALLPDGRIVVAGRTETGGGDADFAVVRYRADGTLDTSWDSDGLLTTSFGSNSWDSASTLAIQSDGKLVVAGKSTNGSTSTFAIARYLASGILDATFDNDGKLTSTVGEGVDGLVLLAAGKLVAAGTTAGASAVVLARYDVAGKPDLGFDTDGVVVTPVDAVEVSGLEVANDGRLFVVGSANNGLNRDMLALRYSSNGAPDSSFDGDGRVDISFGAGNWDYGEALTVQPDGRLILVGSTDGLGGESFAVARLNDNGSRDVSFGGGGLLRTHAGIAYSYASTVKLMGDGRIVAAGGANRGRFDDVALVRYLSNGVLDSTLSGDGSFTGGMFGIGAELAQQSDGKLLAISSAGLARFTQDGTLDVTFGVDGVVPNSAGLALAIQADDRIVVADSQNGGFQVTRYNSVGFPDITFGTGGTVWTYFSADFASPNAVVVQTDGRILVAGFADPGGFALARYMADGSPDTSFDGDGKVTLGFAEAFDVLVLANGKILVAGQSLAAGTSDFALVQLNADGSFDTSFGTGGKQTTRFDDGPAEAYALAVQPDGAIVVAGGYDIDLVPRGTVRLARYTASGILDIGFGSGGKVVTQLGANWSAANDVLLQPDGRIVVAGGADDRDPNIPGTLTRMAMARYLPSGALDSSFELDGRVTTTLGAHLAYGEGMVRQADGRLVVVGWAGLIDARGTWTNTQVALARVLADNTAPMLDNTTALILPTVDADTASNPGLSVAALLAQGIGGHPVSDASVNALSGIAVVGVDNTGGDWQYSLDDGTSWTSFGLPSDATARLLPADDWARVRFAPNANFAGAVIDGLRFRAWDQSVGVNAGTLDTTSSGGMATTSLAIETASVTVMRTHVNVAPSFVSGGNVTVQQNSGPQTVRPWATSISAGPPEESQQVLTFEFTANSNPGLFSAGPAIDPNTGALTFTPASNAIGTVSLTVRLRDNGGTSNGGVNTSAPQSFTITVTPVAQSQTRLSMPQNLSGRPGDLRTLPIELTIGAAGGLMVSGADIVVTYDAQRFAVTGARLGSVLNGFLSSLNIGTPGQLILSASSATGTSLLANGSTHGLFLIDVTIATGAAAGPSSFNLRSSLTTPLGTTTTAIFDANTDEVLLSPAPTDDARDAIDGRLTVLPDVVPGDSNDDGRFDSADLVQVFAAGEYEDNIAGNSTYAEGDWDGDGDFTTSDMVFVFAAGYYLAESRPHSLAVPSWRTRVGAVEAALADDSWDYLLRQRPRY